MIKTETKISVYEVDGEETLGKEEPDFSVRRHWNRSNVLVVVCVGGKEYGVSASELKTAIENASR